MHLMLSLSTDPWICPPPPLCPPPRPQAARKTPAAGKAVVVLRGVGLSTSGLAGAGGRYSPLARPPSPKKEKGSIDAPPPTLLPRLTPGSRK